MANHPHNPDRPMPIGVRRALETGDMEELRLALTPRQRAFAEEYVVDYNATAAAIRAGYAVKHADKQAYALTKHEGVAAYIEHLTRSKQAKLTAIDPDYIVQKVVEIVTKDGTRDGDKLRALELLARHLGMFVDRTEITGKDGGPLEVEQRKIDEAAADFTNALKRLKRPELKVVGDE